jgi:hypothetical protein
MLRVNDTGGERVALRLDGTFDAPAAWRLHEELAGLDPSAALVLDFTRVRDFHDFAVALLAKDLVARRGRIGTRGLCQHQHRLLRYFGFEEGAAAPAAGGTGVEPTAP